ncbi:MAG: DUF4349 domain-containing protein [Clostridia bacterium]|nr:DUF4349 domain-containing protein [Clostridia bacterium]
MKKNLTTRILALTVALLLSVLALASCDAGSSLDSAPNMPPVGNGTADGMEGGDGAGSIVNGQPTDDRKIIRTVTMSCETKAYDDAVTLIMDTLNTHGGYVEASNVTGTGYENVKNSARRASYTLRVPAEKLDAFLETLRTNEGIRILSQNATSDEITATYYDTVSRLETLKAEKASLTAMLEGFTDYKDISNMLKVQERLYDVIEEIEALQTKLNLYDGRVAMSTVNLSLNEVIVYTEVVEPDPTFGERIGEAFRESWADFGEGCQDFAVWFVEAFPTLLVLVVIHGGIFLIIYTSVKRGQKKRAAREAAMAAARAAREAALKGENKQ